MVLDGEQHKALRVVLQEGLVGLGGLDGRGHGCLDFLDDGLLDLFLLLHRLCGLGILDKDVLLVGVAEVELLDGRLDLEGLDGSGRLQQKKGNALAAVALMERKGWGWSCQETRHATRHTALEGVTLVAITTERAIGSEGMMQRELKNVKPREGVCTR